MTSRDLERSERDLDTFEAQYLGIPWRESVGTNGTPVGNSQCPTE